MFENDGFHARGVGVDIVDINRFRDKVHNERFLDRIFSPREQRDCGKGIFQPHRLAARWAAKEAVSKALGCGLGGDLSWKDVEVYHNADGQPQIWLSDAANERHNHPQFAVSLAHDGSYAVAFVILIATKHV